MEITTMKKTKGRQKIEIKKIEKQSSLRVTFAKRRRGLFKKASELSILCGAEIAIVLKSPADKIYMFEQPSVEALLNRVSHRDSQVQTEGRRSKLEYEAVVRVLKEEEGRMMSKPFEGLDLQELEIYLAALEGLRENVERRVGETINSTADDALPLSIQDYGSY